jgi:hypothetical protein
VEVQAKNSNFVKHTLKKKHYKRKESSQTLALTIALFYSSLKIARSSILHMNCQQKALVKDTQNNAHMAKKFSAHSKLPHKS